MAKSLFAIGGVESVWILGSGIHVTKDEKTRWAKIQSRIIETIRRAANPVTRGGKARYAGGNSPLWGASVTLVKFNWSLINVVG